MSKERACVLLEEQCQNESERALLLEDGQSSDPSRRVEDLAQVRRVPCDKDRLCKEQWDESGDPCTPLVSKAFDCGHAASLDRHKWINAACQEPCPRKCPRDHRCPGTCGEPCRPCSVVVDKILLCGHVIKVKCYEESDAVDRLEPCGMKVIKQLACKHAISMECDRDPATELCGAKVRKLLPCGHSKVVECCKNPEEEECTKSCSRVCERGHPCPDDCNKICPPCKVLVKKELPCSHTKMVGCFKDPAKEACVKQCTRSCANGHPCPQKCTHQCEPCTTPMAKLLPCGHSVELSCHEDLANQHCMEKVVKTLPCGEHSVAMECGKSAAAVECTEPCRSSLDCGHLCPLPCHRKQTHEEIACQQPCRVTIFGRKACNRKCSERCGTPVRLWNLISCCSCTSEREPVNSKMSD